MAGAPQNTIIGGASLRVMSGEPKAEYKGVAKFYTFLSQPELQAAFSQETGYLPITMAACVLTRKSGFHEKNPGTDGAAQPAADPRHEGRGARGRLDGQEDAAGGASTSRCGGNGIIDRFNKANRHWPDAQVRNPGDAD